MGFFIAFSQNLIYAPERVAHLRLKLSGGRAQYAGAQGGKLYKSVAADNAHGVVFADFVHQPLDIGVTGLSVVYYNNSLLLFGGVDDKAKYLGRDIFVSTNEGITWTKADSTKNQLPESYQARQKLSAIVRDNNIYIFGGEDSEQTYSDAYKGRLNSIDW